MSGLDGWMGWDGLTIISYTAVKSWIQLCFLYDSREKFPHFPFFVADFPWFHLSTWFQYSWGDGMVLNCWHSMSNNENGKPSIVTPRPLSHFQRYGGNKLDVICIHARNIACLEYFYYVCPIHEHRPHAVCHQTPPSSAFVPDPPSPPLPAFVSIFTTIFLAVVWIANRIGIKSSVPKTKSDFMTKIVCQNGQNKLINFGAPPNTIAGR